MNLRADKFEACLYAIVLIQNSVDIILNDQMQNLNN